jgi:hypothetical protein
MGFSKKGALQKHILAVHNTAFQCKECNKFYFSKKNLERHKIRPFKIAT